MIHGSLEIYEREWLKYSVNLKGVTCWRFGIVLVVLLSGFGSESRLVLLGETNA